MPKTKKSFTGYVYWGYDMWIFSSHKPKGKDFNYSCYHPKAEWCFDFEAREGEKLLPDSIVQMAEEYCPRKRYKKIKITIETE